MGGEFNCYYSRARGQKESQRKTLGDFCGKPMILFYRDNVETKLFDEIHVSSDCDETISIAKEYVVLLTFKRPLSLADDKTPPVPLLGGF